jgi:hypothetical protein
MAITAMIILSASLICWTPIVTVFILNCEVNLDIFENLKEYSILDSNSKLFCLAHSYELLLPLIYVFRVKEIRKAIGKLFPRGT